MNKYNNFMKMFNLVDMNGLYLMEVMGMKVRMELGYH